jgi:hypothetical protein
MSEIRNINAVRLADVIDGITNAWHMHAPGTVRVNKFRAKGGDRGRVRAVLSAAREGGLIVEVDEEGVGFREAAFTFLLHGGQQVIDVLHELIAIESSGEAR